MPDSLTPNAAVGSFMITSRVAKAAARATAPPTAPLAQREAMGLGLSDDEEALEKRVAGRREQHWSSERVG